MPLLDGQVHPDTHALPMGNYVIVSPSELGNYMIADNRHSWMVATVFIRIATISNREQMFAHCAICLRLEVRGNA